MVADATRAYSHAQELGLKVSMPLKEEVWGQVHFMVQDPSGINIDIVQHQAVSE
ncbi:VOC family protein [Vibrio mexicanus]|uniref:VOC family protein n=1 Tax=Vibrio mexicanus TaxID=1004326 RepID=UPI002351E659|nr:VOC family protein [Vibrio mexicanus]